MSIDTPNHIAGRVSQAARLEQVPTIGQLLRGLLVLAVVLSVGPAPSAQAQGFTEQVIQSGLDGPRSVVTADMNGDGFQDAVVAAINADKVLWFEHDGQPVPTFTAHEVGGMTLDGPRDVHVADVDADGDRDVLVVTLTPDTGGAGKNGQLIWFENDGTASFTPIALDETLLRPRAVSTGDIDGDGALDILVASAEDSDIFYYRNDGTVDPGFGRRSVTGDVPGVSAVDAADLDGDGDIDVAATILEGRSDGIVIEGNRVVWIENVGDTSGNGKPNFVETTVQSNATGAIDVQIADVNGDGALDLVTATQGDGTIAWHEQDGAADPTFTTKTVFSGASDVRSVHVADAEGDGDVDIFGAAFGDDAVYAFANNGMVAPTFTQETVATGVSGAIDIAVAALDGDDKRDVIVLAGKGDQVLWYKNESSVLPVELVDFRIVTNGTTATLMWQTLSETNNDGFAVERQANDGFEQIGYVRGAGTTVEAQSYRFETGALAAGTHVFRLRQVDRDGTVAYSPEVEVEIALDQAYTLSGAYPNPFRHTARLELRVREMQHVRVEAFDYLGRRVATLHDDVVPADAPQPLVLNGQRLPSGAYFIRAVGENFRTTRTVTLVR